MIQQLGFTDTVDYLDQIMLLVGGGRLGVDTALKLGGWPAGNQILTK